MPNSCPTDIFNWFVIVVPTVIFKNKYASLNFFFNWFVIVLPIAIFFKFMLISPTDFFLIDDLAYNKYGTSGWLDAYYHGK